MSAVLEANLRALEARDPALAGSVRAARPDPRIAIVASRTGRPVPVADVGGRRTPLHSLADPEREAARLAGGLREPGFVVLLGLGGGFEAAAALALPGLSQLLVIEGTAAAIRALFEGVDFTPVLADERLRIEMGPTAAEAEELLAGSWLPALAGGLAVLPLRPWCRLNREYFDPVSGGLASAVERVKADYAAQARFGRRWFANALANLPAIERADLEVPPTDRAIVTGAGPTLDSGIGSLAAERRGKLLIATDTSLPALLARGISPDLAISIDCQQWGYHHFLCARAAAVPVILDVSSPPVLARSLPSVGFFASGHPLAGYLARRFRALPSVDTSGGNVSHAAASLARSLGATEVCLHGVDFSCRLGSPYARGTWLHDLFRTREDRLHTVEGAFYPMLVATPGTVREQGPEGTRYVTPLMRDYRSALDRLLSGTVPRAGAGFRMGQPATAWREFLSGYAGSLAGLAPPGRPLARWFARLSGEERELWRTLLPIVPALPPADDRAGQLEHARRWATDRALRRLRVEDGRVADE